MGNTGSAHNLHLEDVSSELNSYYHSQQLRHASKRQQQQQQQHHWTRSLPHVAAAAAAAAGDAEASSAAPASMLPQVKVLPQLNERLKLRTTTNGAILHSGGTISGRREQQVAAQRTLAMQQRSRTFIDEPKAEWQQDARQTQQQRAAPPPFRRAQTLLHLDYNSSHNNNNTNKQKQTNTGGSSASPPSSTELKTTAMSVQLKNGVRLNKYNKKRKAPAVPLAATTTTSTAASAPAVTPTAVEARPTRAAAATTVAASGVKPAARESLTKPRLFRSNAGKAPATSCTVLQQQQQQPQPAQQEKQRQLTKPVASKGVPLTKLTSYRREKSSDAILIRQRGELQSSALTRTLSGNGADKRASVTAAPAATTASQTAPQAARSEKAMGAPMASKIPQLNRTFYFGMSAANDAQQPRQLAAAPVSVECAAATVANNSTAATAATAKATISTAAIAAEAAASAAAADAISHYKLSISPDAKAIVDNGLLVHMRPTLPRRQLSTPSFSPAAAWRMLVEEQQKLQKNNSSQQTATTFATEAGNGMDWLLHTPLDSSGDNHKNANGALKEAPIQLHKTELPSARFAEAHANNAELAVTWTPQQDLEDDDDDEDEDADADEDNDDVDVDDEADDELHEHEHEAEPHVVGANFRHNTADVQHAAEGVAMPTSVGKQRHCLNDIVATSSANTNTTTTTTVQKHRQCATRKAPGVHVFSLSLPREAHLQAHLKNRLQSTAASLKKDELRGFSSLQKHSSNARNQCGCLDASGRRRLLSDADSTNAALVAETSTACSMHSNHMSASYGNDNWVLHKTKSTSSLALVSAAQSQQASLAAGVALAHANQSKWDALASIEPISLTYLTAGKHVMYLPEKQCSSTHAAASKRSTKLLAANQQQGQQSVQPQQALQQQHKRQRRVRPARESLQDAVPAHEQRATANAKSTATTASSGSAAAHGADRTQRFSFQSTVRLLEKRRLAEKLAKDAEIREAQRKSELEIMKRVEEDFQRKRASEKASIRNQLLLYFSGADALTDTERQEQQPYSSLPPLTAQQPHAHDSNNNNISCRADPDGAVSTPSPVLAEAVDDKANLLRHAYEPLPRRYDSDCGESDMELEMAVNFKRTASLVEPYLQSIIH